MNSLSKYISAAIIVKNEETNIINCLNSIRNYCGQIVVVDTGSEDQTAKLVSNFGADILYKKWNNDFSEARNFAISHCFLPWILIIDADEFIINLDLEEEELNNNNIGGFNLIIKNFLTADFNGPISEHRYTRIIRNDKRIRFTDKIHEQIRESIENNGFEIIETENIIFHTGYIDKNINKLIRNKELLEIQSQETGEDWDKFHLADTEFSLGNKEKSYELFNSLIESKNLTTPQIDKIKIRLAQINLDSNKLDEAEKLLNFKSDDTELEGFRIFVLAAAKLSQQNYQDALVLYENPKLTLSNLVDKKMVERALKILRKI